MHRSDRPLHKCANTSMTRLSPQLHAEFMANVYTLLHLFDVNLKTVYA
jgi:hypothetical protein